MEMLKLAATRLLKLPRKVTYPIIGLIILSALYAAGVIDEALYNELRARLTSMLL